MHLNPHYIEKHSNISTHLQTYDSGKIFPSHTIKIIFCTSETKRIFFKRAIKVIEISVMYPLTNI